jgi:preprotein translocase subunit SecB
MAQEIDFPFQLNNAFFVNLQLSRLPVIPDQLTMKFAVDLKVQDQKFPNELEVYVRLRTLEEQPLTFNIELVGQFSLIEGTPAPSPDIISDFINKQALFMLWPYLVQVIKQVTAQMGTNPVNIATPHSFHIELAKQVTESVETEEDSKAGV